jgi:hypothetical protein
MTTGIMEILKNEFFLDKLGVYSVLHNIEDKHRSIVNHSNNEHNFYQQSWSELRNKDNN